MYQTQLLLYVKARPSFSLTYYKSFFFVISLSFDTRKLMLYSLISVLKKTCLLFLSLLFTGVIYEVFVRILPGPTFVTLQDIYLTVCVPHKNIQTPKSYLAYWDFKRFLNYLTGDRFHLYSHWRSLCIWRKSYVPDKSRFFIDFFMSI